MEVICLEEKAFYTLVEEVVSRLSEKQKIPAEKWIDAEQAMHKLRIKSPTTLQQLRDQGKIRFSQPSRKSILYDTHSIDDYLESNAKNTF